MNKFLKNILKESITWGSKKGNRFYDQHGELIDFVDKEIRKYFNLSQYSGSDYSVQWSAIFDKIKGKPDLEHLSNLLKSNFGKDYDFKYKLYGKGDLRLVINKQRGFVSEVVITPKDVNKMSMVLKMSINDYGTNPKVLNVYFELTKK